jgi:cell division transport system permease protein
MSWIRLVWLAFKDIRRDFSRHKSSFTLAIVALAAGLFVTGGGLLGVDTLDRWVKQTEDLARVTVFAADGANVASLEQRLKGDPRFTSVRLVSSAEATKRFMESVKEAGLILDTLGHEAVPDNLELALNKNLLQFQKAVEIGQDLRRIPGVGDVVVDHERLDSLLKGARSVRMVLSAFGFVLLTVAAFSTGIVVRMSIASREEEINIMRLVGANETYILIPLLTEGAVLGLFAALTAIGGLWLIWLPLSLGKINISPFIAEAAKLVFFSYQNLILLSVTGLLTGGLGALWGFRNSAQNKKAAEKLMKED